MDEITKLANAAELLGALAEDNNVDLDSLTEEELHELLGYAAEVAEEDDEGELDGITHTAAVLVNEKLASAGYSADDLSEEQAEYLLDTAIGEVEKNAGLYLGGPEGEYYHMGSVFAQGFNDQLQKQAILDEDIEKIAGRMGDAWAAAKRGGRLTKNKIRSALNAYADAMRGGSSLAARRMPRGPVRQGEALPELTKKKMDTALSMLARGGTAGAIGGAGYGGYRAVRGRKK